MKVTRRTALKTSLLSGLGLLLTRNSIANGCLTTPDIEGPFYIPGSPELSKLSPSGAAGTPLFITGTVYANDCQTPLENAEVDVWHANDGGDYHNTDYRGIIKTDASGGYAFESVLPGKYLNGSTYRPRHLHYKVSASDIDTNLELTTQIYFKGDTSIPNDPWASDPDADERIIPLNADGNGAEHGVADIVLDVEPPATNDPNDPGTGVESQGSLNNTIRSVYPNPVVNHAEVQIALNKSSVADLRVFDLNGREVLRLIDGAKMNAGVHRLSFRAENSLGLKLRPGVYILKLWQNGRPVDVKRFSAY